MVDRRRTDHEKVFVTRTPLRVSFAGGGTDLPAFYEQEDGAVLSTAINRYVYVTVKRHSELFFEPIRINYSRSEQVDRIDEIENNIAREALRLLEIDAPIYISTVGDVPASTGLGGSSAFAVGLLNALHAYRGERVSAGQLAEEACELEIDILHEPIGKQDQYAAAFGGCNVFTFSSSGSVSVQHQRFSRSAREALFGSMLMFWTGHQRDASSILTQQQQDTERKRDQLSRMRDQVSQLHTLLMEPTFDITKMGALLDEAWQLKRGITSDISNSEIDRWYAAARDAGAEGGKLCGAGGGGFLLFLVPVECQAAVRSALGGLIEMPVAYESHGSQILLPSGSVG
jgi:D-glycero-alpha-D-manno-heptose-7-phosphate kinase